jgi:hypothetical protein
MPTATIKLFLAQGDPKRLRTAEISNWTGKAIAGPRSELVSILDRDEAEHSGVYFLTGTDPDSGKDAVYIGEAEVIRDRIKGHLERDFWNIIVYVVSKDENLTKAHIRYLEGRLIEQAKAAERALVVNGQASGSKLPESDREDMEVFLDRIHQLLPVLGADFLVPVRQQREIRKRPVLVCEIKGLVGRGVQEVNGFVVLKGSQAVVTERPSAERYLYAKTLRDRLLQQGALVQKENWLEFTRDTEFTSPSAAAAVIHGGNANGLIAWKTEDGKTLNELEAV